jgi:hypothetical protein
LHGPDESATDYTPAFIVFIPPSTFPSSAGLAAGGSQMKRLSLLAATLLIAMPAYGQVNLGTSASSTNPERSGDSTTGLFSSTSGAVSISSAGTEMMRVNGNGVGIGTASPTGILEMDTSGTGYTNTWNFNNGDSSNTPTFFISNNNSGDQAVALVAGTIGTNLSFTEDGPFSIIVDTKANITGHNLGSTGTTLMYIAPGGNVGIGTSSPSNPLTVNGIIQSLTGGYKFPDGTTQTTAATAAASTGMVLLATVNASGASSVSFGSSYITTSYNKYVLEFDGVYTNDAGTLDLFFSTSNGSSYLNSNYGWNGMNFNTFSNAILLDAKSSQGQISLGGGTGAGFTQGTTSSTSSLVSAGTLKFSNLAEAVRARVDWQIDWQGSDGHSLSNNSPYSGFNTTTTAINAIKITDDSGGTISGNFHLYGLSGN